MLHDVEIDPNEPLSASYQVASARAASALKDLPKSFQEEIGASDGPDWFAATIQKLASFATSVLKENAQLRWNAELIQARSPPSPRQAADEAGGYSDRNGSESMEEGARSTRSELHLEEAEMRQAEAEAALQLRKSECAKLAEAESKAEARLQTLEMRLADKQSQGQVSQPSHSRSQSSNRSNLTQSRLRRTSDQKKPSADSPKKLKKRSPREIKASPHTSKERGDKKSTGPTIPKLADAPRHAVCTLSLKSTCTSLRGKNGTGFQMLFNILRHLAELMSLIVPWHALASFEVRWAKSPSVTECICALPFRQRAEQLPLQQRLSQQSRPTLRATGCWRTCKVFDRINRI